MDHRFIGNSICCGTYAVLNLLEWDIDVDLFELTTGVPFGIKGSIEEGRLLTTFVNPNTGIDIGLKIWGIKGKKYAYKNKQQAYQELRRRLEQYGELIVGPLDMLCLHYIPYSTMYSGLDHYILLKKTDDIHVAIKDSEGYLAVTEQTDHFMKLWQIHNVIEADGYYAFRTVEKTKRTEISRDVLLKKSFILMKKNLIDAEQACYGSRVFSRILRFIGSTEDSGWRNRLKYDFTHLLQRKILAEQLLTELSAGQDGHFCKKMLGIIQEQIQILPILFYETEKEESLSADLLNSMGELEKNLYRLSRQ